MSQSTLPLSWCHARLYMAFATAMPYLVYDGTTPRCTGCGGALCSSLDASAPSVEELCVVLQLVDIMRMSAADASHGNASRDGQIAEWRKWKDEKTRRASGTHGWDHPPPTVWPCVVPILSTVVSNDVGLGTAGYSLLTWNVCWTAPFVTERMAAIGEVIEAERPSMIALQEIRVLPHSSTYDLLCSLPWVADYDLFLRADIALNSTTLWGVRRDSGCDVIGHSVIPLDSRRQRSLHTIVVQIGADRHCPRLAFTTVHAESMPDGSNARMRQLRFAFAECDGNEPVFVTHEGSVVGDVFVDASFLCGDFNLRSHEWRRVKGTARAHGWDWLKTRKKTFGYPNILATQGWDPKSRSSHHFDRVFVSRNQRREWDLLPGSRRVVGEVEFEAPDGSIITPSDHYGVLVEFSFVPKPLN